MFVEGPSVLSPGDFCLKFDHVVPAALGCCSCILALQVKKLRPERGTDLKSPREECSSWALNWARVLQPGSRGHQGWEGVE